MIGRKAAIIAALLVALLASRPALADTPAAFTDEGFAAAQAQGRTIVIETFAQWCLPCRLQEPILERIRKRKPFESILILRIGEETPPETWKRFRLSGYGTLLIYKGNREVARGNPTDEPAIVQLLRQAA